MRKSQESTTVRQNSRYTATNKHATNLQRNTTLHFQIGLILALLVSIFFVEMRMPQTAILEKKESDPVEEIFTIDQVQVEKKVAEISKIKALELPKEPKILDRDPETTENPLFEDTPIDAVDPTDRSMVNPTLVDFDETIEDPDPKPTIFSLVEQVPLFPGCDGLSTNRERRDCMNSKITKFVTKRFRTDKGEGLGLEGVNRIFVTFKIDVNGKVVGINARGPHKKLEEEAMRVTSLLPDMTPGKQGGNNVPVLFSLPISFKIQD